MSQIQRPETSATEAEQASPDIDRTRTMQPGHVPAAHGEEATRLKRHEPAPTRPDVMLPRVDPAHYAMSGELARGGIGRILRARDLRLDRPVAVKELISPAWEAEPRFVAEAFVTARLQHPAIVPVYEAGRWPDGKPFYSMKLVSGRSLADVIAERESLDQRLELLPHVLTVSEAIAYAHSERIIHRDLKPANVLVGDFGETVVIDWGLAKDLSRAEEVESTDAEHSPGNTPDEGLTRVGTVMGTPAYMPPEQAAGQPVDERADVYALGAILYHLLAGIRPYEGQSSEQVLRCVVDGPPPPLAARQEGIPVELLAIVTKAMARQPSERYPSARALSEDLRRFQTGQIVGAHQYSRVQLLRRFVRRYRAAVTVTGVAVVLLLTLGVVSFLNVVEQRNTAKRAQEEALDRADELLLMQARAAVEQVPNEALSWLLKLSPRFKDWATVRTIAADARAQGFATVLRGHAQHVNSTAFSADGRWLVSASDDHTLRVWDLQSGDVKVLTGHTDEAWNGVFLPEGRGLVSGSKDGTLRRWDLTTGQGTVLATLSGPVSGMGLGCRGGCVVAVNRKDDVLYRWDVATGAVHSFHTGVTSVGRLTISPDGTQVFIQGNQHAPSALGDVERGTFQVLDPAAPPRVGAFSPDGRLFTVNPQGQLQLWTPGSTRARLLARGLGVASALAFVPGTSLVAVGTRDGTLSLWNIDTGESRELPLGHEARVTGLDVTQDGRYLVSGSADRTARLWDLSSNHPPRVLRGSRGRIHAVLFSPDGQRLALPSSDGQVRLFSVKTEVHELLAENPSGQRALVLSADGRRLASLSARGVLRLLDTASGASLLEEPGVSPNAIAFSPKGRWLAFGGASGRVHLRESSTGGAARSLAGHEANITALRFSAEGRALATADEAGDVWLWNPTSGTGHRLGAHGTRVRELAFSPEGGRLASSGDEGTVRVWDVAAGTSRPLRGHEDTVLGLAFFPDGKRLVSGGMDHTLRFWDLETGQGERRDASGGGILELRMSPDGAWVAVRNEQDGRVMLWDGKTGEPRGILSGHLGDVTAIAFSPDSTRLASASLDKTVRLWDLSNQRSRALRGHTGDVEAVAFFPDGNTLVSTGQDGGIRLWPDDLPREPEALRAWMKRITGDEPPPGND